jgi:hypothetical protein
LDVLGHHFTLLGDLNWKPPFFPFVVVAKVFFEVEIWQFFIRKKNIAMHKDELM